MYKFNRLTYTRSDNTTKVVKSRDYKFMQSKMLQFLKLETDFAIKYNILLRVGTNERGKQTLMSLKITISLSKITKEIVLECSYLFYFFSLKMANNWWLLLRANWILTLSSCDFYTEAFLFSIETYLTCIQNQLQDYNYSRFSNIHY